jgi:hypothetical protein
MKRVLGTLLAAILFSATLVSFCYAQAGCCPGGGCCGTSNTWGDQQRFRVLSPGFDQTQPGTVIRSAPQIAPNWRPATVNQIGAAQFAPVSVSTGGRPGTNSGGGKSDAKSAFSPRLTIVDRIMAFTPVLGTLW